MLCQENWAIKTFTPNKMLHFESVYDAETAVRILLHNNFLPLFKICWLGLGVGEASHRQTSVWPPSSSQPQSSRLCSNYTPRTSASVSWHLSCRSSLCIGALHGGYIWGTQFKNAILIKISSSYQREGCAMCKCNNAEAKTKAKTCACIV